MIVDFEEATDTAWYAMQHYMNIMDSWMNSRRMHPAISLAYFAGQYADLNIRLLDGPERDGLGNALWKIYVQTYNKAPKSADNLYTFFTSGAYYMYNDNWPMIASVINKVIERSKENGPRSEEDRAA